MFFCQRIAVLSKIKWFLRLKQRKVFYNPKIKHTILYASNVRSACSTGNLQRVFHLQKQSAHIILDADTQANSDELFTRLDWLPLHLTVPNSLEKIECVHSFRKALIDFYASS